MAALADQAFFPETRAVHTDHSGEIAEPMPMPMGYSNVGTVIEVGAGVEGFSVGDRVASNGRHAEIRAGFAHVQFGLEYAIALC